MPRFKAFLSYSHAADDKLAPAVQIALHRIARPWYRVRSMWIFRDKTGLSADPSLWGTIEKGLAESEYFLLMASPEAAQSKWVQQELEWWLAKWGNRNLLVLVTGGEIRWDPVARDWDWSVTTALPPSLRGRMAQEPLWVDLRWAKSEERLSLRHAQFRDAILDIASTLLGKAKESLDSEDMRVYRRNRYAAYAAVIVSLVLAAGAGTAAVFANRERILANSEAKRADTEATRATQNAEEANKNATEASRQKDAALAANVVAEERRREAERQARIADSGRLAAIALLSRDNHLDLASLLSIEATRTADTFEARNALFTIFESNPRLVSYLYHPAVVNCVAISPDGKTIAAGENDGSIQLWDVATRRPLGDALKGHPNSVRSVAFSPDSKTLASASLGLNYLLGRRTNGTIQLWDVASRRPLGEAIKGHEGNVNTVAFSPDGRILASGGDDHTIRLWRVASREPIGEALTGHQDEVWSLAFSPHGETLVSAGADLSLRLWDVATQQARGQPMQGHPVWAVAFSPDGRTLASANRDGTVQLWDPASGAARGEPLQGHESFVNSVAFSPDGTTLASASSDMTIRLWDVRTGEPLGEPFQGHRGSVWSVVFSPDGNRLVSASEDHSVRLWNVTEGQPLKNVLQGHDGRVVSLAFSPNGRILASGGMDATVRLWDAITGQPLGKPLTGHRSAVIGLDFGHENVILASASLDQAVVLWAVPTQRPFKIGLPGGASPTSMAVAFSPDEKTVAIADVDVVQLWNMIDGHPVAAPLSGHKGLVTSLAFSPNGKTLASGGADRTVRLWDVARGSLIGKPLEGRNGGVSSLAFTPDGTIVTTATDDGSLQLWNVSSGQLLTRLTSFHSGPMNSLGFSPDSRMLVSVSQDHTARLWDVASGHPLGEPLKDPLGAMWRVAFSPDGKTLATAGDGGVRLWDVDPDSWRARACFRANRNLSSSEWQEYIGTNVAYHLTCPAFPAGDGVSVQNR